MTGGTAERTRKDKRDTTRRLIKTGKEGRADERNQGTKEKEAAAA